METYAALIVDIEKSRGYGRAERQALQERLLRCLDDLNRLFRPSLAVPVGFSAGDEFQGLFRSPAAAYRYFRLLVTLTAPVALRAGIGIGDWTLRVDGGRSTEQDGTAYHRARHALEGTQDGAGRVCFFSGSDEDVLISKFLSIEQGRLGRLGYILYAKLNLLIIFLTFNRFPTFVYFY